ncbi:hypothetical protein D3C79_902560 [compost metagenome]
MTRKGSVRTNNKTITGFEPVMKRVSLVDNFMLFLNSIAYTAYGFEPFSGSPYIKFFTDILNMSINIIGIIIVIHKRAPNVLTKLNTC